MSLTKNPKAKTQKIFSLQTTRLAKRFEQLSRTYGARVVPAQSHVQSGYFHTNH